MQICIRHYDEWMYVVQHIALETLLRDNLKGSCTARATPFGFLYGTI